MDEKQTNEILDYLNHSGDYDAEVKQIKEEFRRLRQWVSDCQSGMYVNCVYCGHRYGPDKTTPVSHADLLKAHIEVCPDHPMSALKKSNETLRRMLEGRARYHQKVEEHLRKLSYAPLPAYDDAMSERIWIGMDSLPRRDEDQTAPEPSPSGNRYICTKDAPWTPDKGERVAHPEAVEVADLGECARYKCPHCGETWKEELPQ